MQASTSLPGIYKKSALLNESNDEIERLERRKSAAVRRSALARLSTSTSCLALDDSLRLLSHETLKSRLHIICKLNSENRINSKNAWNLRIIDVLKQIVTKNNPEVLKIAGNSLDIAAKVYGLRVDDLYSESLKLANILATNFTQTLQDEENDENKHLNASNKGNLRERKHPKKKRLFLSGNKNQNINNDSKAFLGTLPELVSGAFSNITDATLSLNGNLFTNKISMDPAGYKFMFLTKEKAVAWIPGNDQLIKLETNKKFPIAIKSVKNLKLCGPLKDFRVDLWDPNEENAGLLKKSYALEDVLVDNEGIPIATLDGSLHDPFQNRDSNVEEKVAPLIHQDVEHIVDFRPGSRILGVSTEMSAYSFNSVIVTHLGKIDQIWAGPGHWKLKFIQRKSMMYSGRERKDERNEKRYMKKKFEDVYVDPLKCPPPKDFTKNVAKKVFRKRNLLVDSQKLTIPLLESSSRKLLENIEYLMTVPTINPVKRLQTETGYSETNCKHDIPNKNNGCPIDVDADDNGADLGDDIFNNDDITGGFRPQEGNPYMDANLVGNVGLNYAFRAKKVDMKKLKQAVWYTLTEKEKYDLSSNIIPMPFSKLYKQVPRMLTEKMTAELSCPIVFVALLDLCNQQNLKIQQHADIADFDILRPPS